MMRGWMHSLGKNLAGLIRGIYHHAGLEVIMTSPVTYLTCLQADRLEVQRSRP
jgi:hypothetical protein